MKLEKATYVINQLEVTIRAMTHFLTFRAFCYLTSLLLKIIYLLIRVEQGDFRRFQIAVYFRDLVRHAPTERRFAMIWDFLLPFASRVYVSY